MSLGEDDILEGGIDLADWASKLSFENYYESWVPPGPAGSMSIRSYSKRVSIQNFLAVRFTTQHDLC